MKPSSHEANMKAVQENQSIPKTIRPDQSKSRYLRQEHDPMIVDHPALVSQSQCVGSE